jgi:hypothetical protein
MLESLKAGKPGGWKAIKPEIQDIIKPPSFIASQLPSL